MPVAPVLPPPDPAAPRGLSALTPTAKGILLMLAAVFLFTLMDALAKALLPALGPVQTVWARYTGQTLVVAAILAPRLLTTLRTAHPGINIARSVCQFGATALFFTGLGHIGLAESTAIMDVNPVLITLGAALFLGERIGPRRLAGVLAALVGALIVIRPGAGVFSLHALFPLGAALCYTAYALLTRHLGGREGVWTALLWAALVGTVLSSLALPWHWTQPSPWQTLGLCVIGLLGAAGQLCIIRAFTLAEAGTVAPFSYVGLVLATLWGALFFGEWPDGPTVLGALVIVGAGLYVWHRETRARPA